MESCRTAPIHDIIETDLDNKRVDCITGPHTKAEPRICSLEPDGVRCHNYAARELTTSGIG